MRKFNLLGDINPYSKTAIVTESTTKIYFAFFFPLELKKIEVEQSHLALST